MFQRLLKYFPQLKKVIQRLFIGCDNNEEEITKISVLTSNTFNCAMRYSKYMVDELLPLAQDIQSKVRQLAFPYGYNLISNTLAQFYLSEGDYTTSMELCSSSIKKTTLWIKGVSSKQNSNLQKSKNSKKDDLKMVVKLLVLTLITRAKLYKKTVQSNEESLMPGSLTNKSSNKTLQKAEKVLNQALSLAKKYIPEQNHILNVIQKEKENLFYFRGGKKISRNSSNFSKYVKDRYGNRFPSKNSQFSDGDVDSPPENTANFQGQPTGQMNPMYQSFDPQFKGGQPSGYFQSPQFQNPKRRSNSSMNRRNQRPQSGNRQYHTRQNSAGSGARFRVRSSSKAKRNTVNDADSHENDLNGLVSGDNSVRGSQISKQRRNQSSGKGYRIGRSRSGSKKIKRKISSKSSNPNFMESQIPQTMNAPTFQALSQYSNGFGNFQNQNPYNQRAPPANYPYLQQQFDYGQYQQMFPNPQVAPQQGVNPMAFHQLQQVTLQLQTELNRLRQINTTETVANNGQELLQTFANLNQINNNGALGDLNKLAEMQNLSGEESKELQRKIQAIQKEQMEYRDLKKGIEKRLDDISKTLGGVGGIFNRSEMSTEQNQVSINRDCLDIRPDFSLSPKSDMIIQEDPQEARSDTRKIRTTKNSRSTNNYGGYNSQIIKKKDPKYGISPKNNPNNSHQSNESQQKFSKNDFKRTQTQALGDDLRKLKQKNIEQRNIPATNYMLSCDYLTTSYFVYLENCLRALQNKIDSQTDQANGTSPINSKRSRSNSMPHVDDGVKEGKIYSMFRDKYFGNYFRIEYEIIYPVSMVKERCLTYLGWIETVFKD